MKILKTDLTGGQPLRINHLGIIQENVKEITSAIAKGLSFGNTAIKLFGADITLADAGLPTANYSITAGALWFQDEVYLIAAQSNVVVANLSQATLDSSYYWNVSSVDSNSLAFYDGISKNIYNTRTMVLSTNSAGILASTTKNISEAISTTLAASYAEVVDGTITNKFVTPYLLGRQADNMTVSFPAYVSNAVAFAPVKRIDGYYTMAEFYGVFTMASEQPYVDIKLDGFKLISYGTQQGFVTVPAKISQNGFNTVYTNLIGSILWNNTDTTIRLYREHLKYELESGTSNATFRNGTTYDISFKYVK